ncbi:hypothetical protein MIS45_06580 [Wielerella bovis]|uniref:hypothetical protein n=1 Tax=Wielerella bovis TaxID=2917790 RepID=UPI002019BAB8|nr:hypothetical protein [Wielerella bovis]ULJ68471.1 hypothetical protein MIS45_06580 [Wielerella bovis]
MAKWTVLLNAIASGLSIPSDRVLGIATATAAPEVSYRIVQYFKEKKAEGTSAHILAHAILGAAVSAAGDNNALAGAISRFTVKQPNIGNNLREALQNDYELQKNARTGINQWVEIVTAEHDATTRMLIEEGAVLDND